MHLRLHLEILGNKGKPREDPKMTLFSLYSLFESSLLNIKIKFDDNILPLRH